MPAKAGTLFNLELGTERSIVPRKNDHFISEVRHEYGAELLEQPTSLRDRKN
jgi:hypothetical protein